MKKKKKTATTIGIEKNKWTEGAKVLLEGALMKGWTERQKTILTLYWDEKRSIDSALGVPIIVWAGLYLRGSCWEWQGREAGGNWNGLSIFSEEVRDGLRSCKTGGGRREKRLLQRKVNLSPSLSLSEQKITMNYMALYTIISSYQLTCIGFIPTDDQWSHD